jgi:uncharacterized protein DUF559/putative AbiEi antitoxin of type IV toxin-antitoxin system/transcriptional regulator with AbiEi antitoxin domain of type IV toxin-antitoxin system
MHPHRHHPPLGKRIGALLRRQHGVVSRAQLLALGFSVEAIKTWIRNGVLVRVERAVYALGHEKLTDEGRWMAALLARGPEAVLSHRTAGMHWGIWRRGSPLIELSVPRRNAPKSRGRVTVHRCAALTGQDTTRKGNIPITRPARTALDIAETATTRETERTVDEIERLRLCSVNQLRDVIERSPGRIGAANLAAVLDDHEAGTTASANDFEELFLALCREYGSPQPEVNVWLGPYKVDFIWREARVIVETDGRETHLTRKAFEADRARDADLTTAGWRVLRFTWRQLTREPEWVAETLLKVLQRRREGP